MFTAIALIIENLIRGIILSNPNEHIVSFLDHYFKLPTAPGYAVLLKGNWGTGKTWFLRETLSELVVDQKQYLYVSLYGVTSFDEIESEFFRQLHPVLSSKGVALAGKLGKGLLSAALQTDIAADIKLPDYLTKTDGLILVFDDLERASIELSSLLGYINYFVEHQGYKVILVANEAELTEGDNDTKRNLRYERIKEKLIGKTFEVQPQVDTALNNFLTNIENPFALKLYQDNFELIKDCYISSEHKNLRNLKQALWDFERFSTYLSTEVKENNDLIIHLFRMYLIFSIEIKNNTISASEIDRLDEYHIENLGSDREPADIAETYQKIFNKYLGFDYKDILFQESIWESILDKGIIPREKIQDSLINSRYFPAESQPEWVQLWHLLYLEDDAFNSILASVSKNFFDMKYTEIGIIKHLTGSFLLLSRIGIISETRAEILDFSKSYIDHLVEKDISLRAKGEDESGFLRNSSWSGLGFHESGTPEFIELYEYIETKHNEYELDQYPKMAKTLLSDIETDPKGVCQKISLDNVHKKWQAPILQFIEPIEFINTILKIKANDRINILLAIASRYKNVGYNKDLCQELDWLKKIVELLNIEADKRKKQISAYQIELIINTYFCPSIKELEKYLES